MFFSNIVEDLISLKNESRLDSVDSFVKYISILADFGKIDIINLVVNYRDFDFIKKHQDFFNDHEIFQKIKQSTICFYEIEDNFSSGFIKNNDKPDFILDQFLKYFNSLNPDISSHEENFKLNFLLNMILNEGILSSELGSKLIDYFWKAKNCNPRRRDYCIFSLVDYFEKRECSLFFKLKKSFYNHIQKVYHQVYRSVLLDDQNKYIYIYT